MNPVVYGIRNTRNNKIYIGSTVDFVKRTNAHLSCARVGDRSYLYKEMRKHGIKNFKFFVIRECKNKEDAIEHEKKYINYFDSYKRKFGYNIFCTSKDGSWKRSDLAAMNRRIAKRRSQQS